MHYIYILGCPSPTIVTTRILETSLGLGGTRFHQGGSFKVPATSQGAARIQHQSKGGWLITATGFQTAFTKKTPLFVGHLSPYNLMNPKNCWKQTAKQKTECDDFFPVLPHPHNNIPSTNDDAPGSFFKRLYPTGCVNEWSADHKPLELPTPGRFDFRFSATDESRQAGRRSSLRRWMDGGWLIHDSENMVFPTLAADAVLVARKFPRGGTFHFPTFKTYSWDHRMARKKIYSIPKRCLILGESGERNAPICEIKSISTTFPEIDGWFTMVRQPALLRDDHGHLNPLFVCPLTGHDIWRLFLLPSWLCSIAMFQFHWVLHWPENPEGKTAEAWKLEAFLVVRETTVFFSQETYEK